HRIQDRSAAGGGVPDQVGRTRVNLLILVVDDEPDVEILFRQQFRHDLRAGRFTMEFAQSAPMALQRITDAGDRALILILSDINMPGMSGLDDAETKRKALGNGAEALLTKPIDFATLRNEIDMRVEVGRDHGLRGRGSETVALNSMSNWYRAPPSTEPRW